MTAPTISPFDAATRLLVFFILMTVLPPLLGWFIGRQLPSYRIRGLQAALHDVEGLYYYCLESGFMNEVPAIEFQARLSRYVKLSRLQNKGYLLTLRLWQVARRRRCAEPTRLSGRQRRRRLQEPSSGLLPADLSSPSGGQCPARRDRCRSNLRHSYAALLTLRSSQQKVGFGGLEAQQRLPQYCDFDVKLQVPDNGE